MCAGDISHLLYIKGLYTVLLLSALLLSNCISTVNQYAARRALVADEVLVLHTPIEDIRQVENNSTPAAIWERGEAYNGESPSTAFSIKPPSQGLN